MITVYHIKFFLLQFRLLNFDEPESQRRIIDIFVNAVFVYDDRVTITFNYSGDNRTITLAEVDGAAESVRASSATGHQKEGHDKGLSPIGTQCEPMGLNPCMGNKQLCREGYSLCIVAYFLPPGKIKLMPCSFPASLRHRRGLILPRLCRLQVIEIPQSL